MMRLIASFFVFLKVLKICILFEGIFVFDVHCYCQNDQIANVTNEHSHCYVRKEMCAHYNASKGNHNNVQLSQNIQKYFCDFVLFEKIWKWQKRKNTCCACGVTRRERFEYVAWKSRIYLSGRECVVWIALIPICKSRKRAVISCTHSTISESWKDWFESLNKCVCKRRCSKGDNCKPNKGVDCLLFHCKQDWNRSVT